VQEFQRVNCSPAGELPAKRGEGACGGADNPLRPATRSTSPSRGGGIGGSRGLALTLNGSAGSIRSGRVRGSVFCRGAEGDAVALATFDFGDIAFLADVGPGVEPRAAVRLSACSGGRDAARMRRKG